MSQTSSKISSGRERLARGGKDGNGFRNGPLLGQVGTVAALRDKGQGSFNADITRPLLSTRNDYEHTFGYNGNQDMAAFSSQYDYVIPLNATESKNYNMPTYYQNPVATAHGTLFIAPPGALVFDRMGYVEPFDLDRTPCAGANTARPRGVRGPHVRSWLSDAKIKDVLDYDIRGNLPFNEWQTALPHVFEVGNGQALGGPPMISNRINVDGL